ncbi:hypothetical protein GIX45_08950 [Erwinia sp. CPCC 100877]|nr:hypothetical protein [Erwinia sp. CPCC 100877]
MNQRSSITSIVLIALFAALTMLATMIKIPMPGAFVHLGNSVSLLAVLLIGYKRGALAGGLGFAIFDTLNGYVLEAPYFFVEPFIVGGAAALVINFFHGKIDSARKILTLTIVAGITKIIMTQLKNTTIALFAGSNFSVAFMAALSQLPATLINTATTVAIVSLVYFPLKKAVDRTFSKTVL